MKKLLSAIAVITFCLCFSSCATLFTKTSYPLSINSDPAGAKILITNKKGETVFTGQTPASLSLDASSKYMSGERYTVTLSREGYKDFSTEISSKIEGWYFGNILLGGLIGMLIVDPLTGAMYKLDTKFIDARLQSETDTANLQIIDINILSEKQKENLVKLN